MLFEQFGTDDRGKYWEDDGATRHRHGICCPAAIRFGLFLGAAGLQFLHCTCGMRSVDGKNPPYRVWPAEILRKR